jgi:NTE family protein
MARFLHIAARMVSGSIKRRAGVVLSGGGGRGAYQVGALKALRSLNVEPEIYSGSSVGAFNAAMAVSGKSLEEMERLWTGTNARDVYVAKLDPRNLVSLRPAKSLRLMKESLASLWKFLRATASLKENGLQILDLDSLLVDMSPAEKLINGNVDIRALRAAGRKVLLTLTRLHPTEEKSIKILDNSQITHRHILASCALPLVFPPVRIGNETFCDGSVVMNSPLKPAIDAGSDDLYVIDLTPPPHVYNEHTLPLAYHIMSTQFSSFMRRDLEFAEDRNTQFLAAFRQGRLVGGRLELSRLERDGVIRKRRYRYIRIYIIRPGWDLGGIESILRFGGDYAAELIAAGERETLEILSRYYFEDLEAPGGDTMKVLRAREPVKDPDIAEVAG